MINRKIERVIEMKRKIESVIDLFVEKTSLLDVVNKGKKNNVEYDVSDFQKLFAVREVLNASEKLDILEDNFADISNNLYNPGNGKLYTFRKPVNFNNDSVDGLDLCLFSMFSKRPIIVKQDQLRIYKLGIDSVFNPKSDLTKNMRFSERELNDVKSLLEEIKRTDFYYGLEYGKYLYHVDLRYETYDIVRKINGYEMILF